VVAAQDDLCGDRLSRFRFGSFGPRSISAAVLGDMRTLDVLAEVVDAFSSGSGESAGAAEAFHAELLLGDLAMVEKRLERLTREKGKAGEKSCTSVAARLWSRTVSCAKSSSRTPRLETLSGFRFLTLKPRIVVANVASRMQLPGAPDLAKSLERCRSTSS
jgi:ribosome-binding ATPase YchF (GTP1/OBG family)